MCALYTPGLGVGFEPIMCVAAGLGCPCPPRLPCPSHRSCAVASWERVWTAQALVRIPSRVPVPFLCVPSPESSSGPPPYVLAQTWASAPLGLCLPDGGSRRAGQSGQPGIWWHIGGWVGCGAAFLGHLSGPDPPGTRPHWFAGSSGASCHVCGQIFRIVVGAFGSRGGLRARVERPKL